MHNQNTKIGLKSAVIVGINAMIGAGIVAMPTVLASKVGPAGIISCIISVIAVMCIGISLGKAAHICPGDGWNYLYPSSWGGHTVGIISAFCYLIGLISGLGLLAQNLGGWFHSFIPYLSPGAFKYIIIPMLTLLVLAGTKASSITQKLIISFVVIPLALTSIFCWFNFNPSLIKPFVPHGLSSIFKASSSILFALIGSESIISLYGVIKNPQKNIPKAFVLSILSVGAIYILFFYGILFAIPKQFFAQGLDEPLSSILIKAFPNAHILSTFLLVGAIFGILGTLHSMIWSVSNLLSTVLKKTKSNIVQVLFEKNIWNQKTSVLTTSSLILLSSIIIRQEDLIYLTVFLVALSYMLSIALLLFKKEEWKSGRNITTLIAMLGGSLIIYFALKNTILAFLNYWG